MSNRRNFIKKSGLLLAGMAVPFPAIINRSRKNKLGVALLGLGSYSKNHLAPALQQTKHIELKGIVTGSPEKIPIWQRQYDIKDANVYDYNNMHLMANNPDIDIVYIVTPTFLHAKYSIIAANAGKDVFCEKPMAMTVMECNSIIDTCKKNKVRLAIGYRMQHEKNTNTIMDWANTRPYGKITKVNCSAGFRIGSGGDWRLNGEKGGGAIYDMGVYPINALRYGSGLEPISVSARHQNERPALFKNGANEITYFDLEFPEGIVGNGMVSYAKEVNKLQVDCVHGYYRLEPFQSYNGVRGTTSENEKLQACNCNQQAIQMNNDALAIKESKALRVPGQEGLRDIRIVEAIMESASKDSKQITI